MHARDLCSADLEIFCIQIFTSFATMADLPPMPLLSFSTEAVVKHCRVLKDCSDGRKTLFISSYPKSGTTWMQAIIYNLLSNGDQNFDHISEYSPFFEREKTWVTSSAGEDGEMQLEKQYEENSLKLGWRVFNTHLRWDMMPKEPNMRYIYVVRNGKDVALSFFQHLSNQDDSDCFNGTLLDFVKEWCDGTIPFGNWINHLQSWMDAYQNHNSVVVEGAARPTILLVRYEDMVNEPFECVQRIISHLELNFTAERAKELLQYVSFAYMKTHQEQYMPISVPWKAGYSFIRNGKVGDSANYFTEEHDVLYNKMLKRIFDETGGVPQWLTDLHVV